MSTAQEQRFLDIVLADPTVRAVLDRAPGWASRTEETPPAPHRSQARGGVRDADLFYFDADTSWDAVLQRR